MSIKPFLITIILLHYSLFGISQNKCILKEEACLYKMIQKKFIISEDSYANNLSEYFILDIKLSDKSDSILKIEYFGKKASHHSAKIDSICEVIKKEWKPLACGYKRIIIPIFLIFSSADSLDDYPIDFSLKKKENELNTGNTYLLKTIIINIQARVKKTSY